MILRIGIEAIHEFGISNKVLDEWEEVAAGLQTCAVFQIYLQDSEEKFNLKKRTHEKKGNTQITNSAVEKDEPPENSNNNEARFDLNNMNAYLDNLTVAASQEKDTLEKIVKTTRT